MKLFDGTVGVFSFGHFEYSISLANGLAGLARVLLLLPARAADLVQQCLDPGVEFVPIPEAVGRTPAALPKVIRLLGLLRSLSPDILHIQGVFPWLLPFLPYLRQRCVLVNTIHDVLPHKGERYWLKVAFNNAVSGLFCHAIVVHGQALRQAMISRYRLNPKRVHAIPHGAYSIFRRWAQPELREDGSVLFFGRMEEYKGLDTLVAAAPAIRQASPQTRIVLAGRGPELDRLRPKLDQDGTFVVHQEHIPYPKVAELFQRASVVALPYREASQSGVLAIAYAFGKPIVASRVGSIPEVVEDGVTGLLVEPENPQALAERVISLLNDERARQRIGKAALAKADGELAWERIAQETMAVYQCCLAQKGISKDTSGGENSSEEIVVQ